MSSKLKLIYYIYLIRNILEKFKNNFTSSIEAYKVIKLYSYKVMRSLKLRSVGSCRGRFTTNPHAFTTKPHAFTTKPHSFTTKPHAFTTKPHAFDVFTTKPHAFLDVLVYFLQKISKSDHFVQLVSVCRKLSKKYFKNKNTLRGFVVNQTMEI